MSNVLLIKVNLITVSLLKFVATGCHSGTRDQFMTIIIFDVELNFKHMFRGLLVVYTSSYSKLILCHKWSAFVTNVFTQPLYHQFDMH